MFEKKLVNKYLYNIVSIKEKRTTNTFTITVKNTDSVDIETKGFCLSWRGYVWNKSKPTSHFTKIQMELKDICVVILLETCYLYIAL